MSTPVAVGSVAPDLALPFDGRGRPRVLAFVRGHALDQLAPDQLDAIQAELRGLGAVLAVLAGDTVWSFRPDDELEVIAGPSAGLARHLATAGNACGVDREHDALFVIDADGVVRFAHVAADALAPTLAAALATAHAAVVAKPRPALFTRGEWTVTCLIAGFVVAAARSRATATA
jgi:hypothetical protein